MALAKTATITRKQPKKSLKNSSWGLVTVPGRLHRVVYIAPWASAGYRGCIPWWTRSHHPGSPSSHSDRKREEADIFFFSSLNRLPPSALGLFSSATPLLWLTGLTSPQLVAVSFSAQPRLSHTLPPPFLASHAPSLSDALSAFCWAYGGQCQSSAIYSPSCLLSGRSLIIHEGDQLFGVYQRGWHHARWSLLN